MPPSVANRNASRRAAQTQEKPSNRLPSMAAVMSGLDLKVGFPSFVRGRDSSRSNTTRGTSLDSQVPSVRPGRAYSGRSSSPRRRWLSPNSRGQITDPGKPATPATPSKKETSPMESTDKEPTPAPTPEPPQVVQPVVPEGDAKSSAPGEERLEKDHFDSENNPIETSDEDGDDSISSDDDASQEDDPETVERGRKQVVDADPPVIARPLTTTKTAPIFRPVDGAADETDTTSTKQGPIPKKPDVHPRTSFDSASATNTPFGSDDEAELCDIKRAQKLGIQMSSIDSTVQHRSIRTIIRGDYTDQEEMEGSRRRQRKYLVATDLSEESVYALEWTIGTILRDGDTMFAVCAMHDESATPASVQIGEGAKAMQDAAAVIGSQTAETASKSHNDSNSHLPRALFSRLGTDSKPSSVDARGMSKAESERVHAAEVISQTCVRLLRKTLLQVRVAVEVIHCKSPKHMITEAIDGLDPTLVIVGARGRGALKGVLLGSFSNYLVMHSSVPVMVARKKLKQTKNKKTNIRLSNNLTTPKKLALAKID
ncbi:adenine nucleotide alpha hydrolases-like protein [Aspergillus ellipticus CBS 707.79]|uniref:Adenine nucleotide alpha hydrolases-like protein n=1 Tax=Aspergillus ellipticus CBS 707.79 TaxID=1448320 RepID=A0A319DPX7_9EURO|nr:adenine nucleotide alpha hydrolases-like protein [Aspergillus ellipticus CBS 707.79]